MPSTTTLKREGTFFLFGRIVRYMGTDATGLLVFRWVGEEREGEERITQAFADRLVELDQLWEIP